jgi:hypothetical protein
MTKDEIVGYIPLIRQIHLLEKPPKLDADRKGIAGFYNFVNVSYQSISMET